METEGVTNDMFKLNYNMTRECKMESQTVIKIDNDNYKKKGKKSFKLC